MMTTFESDVLGTVSQLQLTVMVWEYASEVTQVDSLTKGQ